MHSSMNTISGPSGVVTVVCGRYAYTLVVKPGSGLSASNIVKHVWKCNGGGSHNDAGWMCDESFTQLLTRVGAVKAK